MDKLNDIFTLQEELNDGIFKKKDIKGFKPSTELFGNMAPLTMAEIREQVAAGKFGPNDLPNIWIRNYLRALQDECRELEDATLWKWWSKSALDMQNVRVEIVDMMHFVVSLGLAAGLTANEFHRLYTLKHRVNEQRQENNYSVETKTEDDNKTVV
jgi:dimeric dUTPase (all-alpha-NTP-PPase superfamily)